MRSYQRPRLYGAPTIDGRFRPRRPHSPASVHHRRRRHARPRRRSIHRADRRCRLARRYSHHRYRSVDSAGFRSSTPRQTAGCRRSIFLSTPFPMLPPAVSADRGSLNPTETPRRADHFRRSKWRRGSSGLESRPVLRPEPRGAIVRAGGRCPGLPHPSPAPRPRRAEPHCDRAQKASGEERRAESGPR